MYSIYKVNGSIPYMKYNSFHNLNVLRLDLTEQQLYNFRYNDSNTTDFDINRKIGTSLKK